MIQEQPVPPQPSLQPPFPGNVLYLVRQQATNAVHEANHPPLGGLADEHLEVVPATLVEFAGAAGIVPVFTLPPHPLNCDQYQY